MKVLLIQPKTNPHVWVVDFIFVIEPVWAEYLGAGLRDAHDVRLLDMRVDETPLESVLDEFDPDVVGWTAYTVDVNTVRQLAARVKEWNPRTRTVVGGFFANKNYGEFFDSDFDVVVPGEGINTLRALVDTWERKGLDADLGNVKGLAVRGSGRMELTPVRVWPSLDSYAFPDRRLTANVRHKYFDQWMKPLAAVTSSYSCPFRCEFCCLWPTTDGKYLSRSPESFVDEIASIEEENIWFTDDEAFIDAPRMEAIARLLEERGIRKNYFFMTRSDSIRRNPARFERWARVGLTRVMVGFESVRPQDLIEFNKDATVQDNDEAITILQQNGLDIRANFVLAQDFVQEDFDQLQRYVEGRNLPLPLYFILTPYPGTVTHEKVKDQIFLHDYDFYDLLHTVIPTKMPIRDFYASFSKLYGAVQPLARGIAGYGENLDQIVVRNLRKILESMRHQRELSGASPPQ